MGKVYLIGAGPGDPELITVKALKAIQQADVILYDRLVNPLLLQEAKEGTDLIFCGKLPSLHIMKQETINHLLVKYGKENKNVVRLKGGDPFVFGRGAEEALALAKSGIEYEVIPGITSGIAAPASADIPVTHRELGRTFAIVTGHCKAGDDAKIDWDALAKAVDTLAIYMGIGHLPSIVGNLIRGGKSPRMPVAIIQEGTTANQKVVTGTLQTIVKLAEQDQIQNPAMVIVGEVVKVGEELAYWKNYYQQLQSVPLVEAN
ncbi:uroporphyrinogen-III C-methyltransferase [Gracilibacillus oryzae]|uniref:Uroporphyrinogen-III C-methyltransferase n=1 Tax=Gracilibacillus oryzae TaxID=1672701 RepID=A0A7C8KRV0_9BACI|nr:uroporphyrinogen-III C-methyltransferase [Gracilibacillus oryzae]KAB8132326.1 uroporphyrinogen-III C-methyltransferase [Gracilibacillus oryzae]